MFKGQVRELWRLYRLVKVVWPRLLPPRTRTNAADHLGFDIALEAFMSAKWNAYTVRRLIIRALSQSLINALLSSPNVK